jgi:type IV secretory pathway TraG/TraD family ATPase VirD4
MNYIYNLFKELLNPHLDTLVQYMNSADPQDAYVLIAVSVFLMFAGWLLATGWGEASGRWQVTIIYLPFFLVAGVATVAAILEVTAGALLFFFRRETAQAYYMTAAAGVGIGVVAGVLSWYIIRSVFQPWLCRVIGASMEGREDHLTDVRHIDKEIPQPLQYNPSRFFTKAQKRQKMFFGIDENRQAVYIDRQKWKKTHVQVCGPTGTGKGVMSCVCLAQSISYGDAVFVIDPKNDEFAPSVLKQECDRAGKPFTLINLNREHHGQLNLLKDISPEDLNSLFIAGFSLGEKGTDADFYKKGDRKAARLISKMAANGPITLKNLAERAHIELDETVFEQSDGFRKSLEEIAEIDSASAADSPLDIADPIKSGGCLYVVGSMEDEAIVILQKMLLLRIVQLVKNRPRNSEQRHVTIFADEIRYLMSKKLGDTLGSVRDKNCNLILAHQSLDDLRCGDVPSPAVVIDNTGLRWLYRSTTEEMAKWISSQTGRILVGQESVKLEQNELGAETGSRERTVRQVERNKIDTNMVQNLPDGVAVMIGAGGARMGFASPIQLESGNKYDDNSKLIYEPSHHVRQETEQENPIIDSQESTEQSTSDAEPADMNEILAMTTQNKPQAQQTSDFDDDEELS